MVNTVYFGDVLCLGLTGVMVLLGISIGIATSAFLGDHFDKWLANRRQEEARRQADIYTRVTNVHLRGLNRIACLTENLLRIVQPKENNACCSRKTANTKVKFDTTKFDTTKFEFE